MRIALFARGLKKDTHSHLRLYKAALAQNVYRDMTLKTITMNMTMTYPSFADDEESVASGSLSHNVVTFLV